MNNEQLRITHYNIPLFLNCYKAYPPSHTTSSSYLIIEYEHSREQIQMYTSIQCKFICPIINNQDKQITMILMEGQCLHKFLLSKRNNLHDPILSQQDIWILILCISSSFMILKQNGFAHRLTHLRQYCIRKIGIVPRYKLIFHSSMISQLKAAQQGLCRWDDLYLSPEQLKQNFIPQKSIVFSLGVMLLNICSNCDRDRSIYKFNAYEVDNERIKYKLNLVLNKYGYSRILTHFIQKCLKINHQERNDFSKLWRYINDLIRKKNIKCWSTLNDIIQKKSKQNSQTQLLVKPQNQINKRLNLYEILRRDKNPHKQKQKQKSEKIISQQLKSQKPQSKKSLHNFLQKQQQNQIQKQQEQEFNTKIMRLGNQYKNNSQNNHNKNDNQFLQQQIYKDRKYNRSHNHNDKSNSSVQTSKNQQQKFMADYRGTFGGNRKFQQQKQLQPSFGHQKLQSSDVIQYISNVRSINQSQLEKYTSEQEQIIESKSSIEKQSEKQTQKIKIQSKKQQKNSHTNPKSKFSNKKQQQRDIKQIRRFNVIQSPQKIYEEQKNPHSAEKQKYAIPQLIKQLKYIKLQQCLKPIQQIIKSFSSIGIWIQGDVYYGDYSKGTRNGLSLQIYSNGEYYYGFFKNDLYHGEGFYFWNQFQYFLGHFHEGHKVWGRLQGQIRYQGGFKGNKRNGQGTCWYSTGQVYSGDWENGKRDGQGFILQPSGTKFVGHWVRGNRRGEGYLQMEKLRIAGFWNGETIQGESLIQYSNGDVFRGKIGPQLQKLNGQYFSKSGTIFKGYFQNDQPSEGMLQYSNGDKYYGQLHKMKRHGYGEYYYTNGLVFKGNWQNNLKLVDQA